MESPGQVVHPFRESLGVGQTIETLDVSSIDLCTLSELSHLCVQLPDLPMKSDLIPLHFLDEVSLSIYKLLGFT